MLQNISYFFKKSVHEPTHWKICTTTWEYQIAVATCKMLLKEAEKFSEGMGCVKDTQEYTKY